MAAAVRRLSGPPARFALAAALLLVGAAALVATLRDASAPAAPTYAPSPAVPRITDQRVLRGVLDATDFEFWGDTLAVLDAVSRRVAIYPSESNTPARVFGAEGQGPGEMRWPTSLVRLAGGRFVVVDLPVIHVFQPDGSHAASLRPRLPCRMNAARVRGDAEGVYLSGNCAGGAGAADTLFAAVLHSRDLADWTLVARQARITLDGRWGSAYSPIEVLGEGTTRHFFGVGITDCLVVIEPSINGPPSTRDVCGIAPDLYSVPPPPGEAANRSGSPRGPAFDWPEPMIRWFVVAEAEGQPIVGRPFSVDSLTLRPSAVEHSDHAAMDLLVADADVITCRRGFCLWRAATPDGVRVNIEDLGSLLREAGGGGP